MSNPLKRRFDPVRELDDDEYLYSDNGIVPSVTMPQPYEMGPWQDQDYGSVYDLPRQSQYLGPSHMNPTRYSDSKAKFYLTVTK
jgi:hypothetical protein